MLLAGLQPAVPAAPRAVHIVTTRADGGPGSLRQAMLDANATAEGDEIRFNISGCGGPCTIRPTVALPVLTDDGTVIDGFTQPGASPPNLDTPALILVELDGSLVENNNGLNVASAFNAVEGLAVFAFGGNGIAIGGPDATGNVVRGNHIGLTASGAGLESRRPNGLDGVFIGLGAQGNVIGGDLLTQRNVLSGNTWSGASVHGAETANNSIIGNFIGLNAAGTGQIHNGLDGVRVYGGARQTRIGVITDAGQRNIISGNGRDGIRVFGSETASVEIDGNLIGTDFTGTSDVPNTGDGVHVFDGAQSVALGGAEHVSLGLIGGNMGHGIHYEGAQGGLIRRHFVGVAMTGSDALSNDDGILIENTYGVTIGDTDIGVLVSGNRGAGIRLTGADTAETAIYGNSIGPSTSGTVAVGNRQGGIVVEGGAHDTSIGTSSVGNLIAGNQSHGIDISGDGTSYNVIVNNRIGVATGGSAAMGNEGAGIAIRDGADGNRVGGFAANNGNLIGGNEVGVLLTGVASTLVYDNRIGGGSASESADLANRHEGLKLEAGTTQTRIVGNTIARNGGHGVLFRDPETMDNRLEQNIIFDNGGAGAILSDGAHGMLSAPRLTFYNPDTLVVHGETCASCDVALFSDDDGEGREPLSYELLPLADRSSPGEASQADRGVGRRAPRGLSGQRSPAAPVFFFVRLDAAPSYDNLTALHTDPDLGSSGFSAPLPAVAPTATPTLPTATATRTATLTPTPTSSATESPSTTATASSSPEPSATASPTATGSPSRTTTATASPTSSAGPTGSPSTPTPSSTSTVTLETTTTPTRGPGTAVPTLTPSRTPEPTWRVWLPWAANGATVVRSARFGAEPHRLRYQSHGPAEEPGRTDAGCVYGTTARSRA